MIPEGRPCPSDICLRPCHRSGIPVPQLPDEAATWKRRADWLRKDFQSPAKSTVQLLENILDFFNGDTAETTCVHWCVQSTKSGKPCCADDADSLSKAIAMMAAFFSKGFAVPLLYRMKHYGPAAAFMRVGCCLHQILPRVLNITGNKQKLKGANMPGSEFSNVVDALLADNKPAAFQSEQPLSNSDFETLLATVLDEDKNYAAQNGARNQLVQKELSDPAFHQNSIIIDILVQQMEEGVNFFLRRTKVLYDLQCSTHANPKVDKLKKESRESFLRVIRGEFGRHLISKYTSLLDIGLYEAIEMGLDGTQQQLNLIFQMAVSCMSDLYRRLVQEYQMDPFTLLCLADVEPKTFASGWNVLRSRFLRCNSCVDIEFTAGFLLRYEREFSIPPTHDELQIINEIQETLLDVCTWAPLTSDQVEILNGQLQWALSRRGSQYVKQERAAVETSLLSSAVKQHSWLQHVIGDSILPSKKVASGIRRLSGTKSSNQYTPRGEEQDLVV